MPNNSQRQSAPKNKLPASKENLYYWRRRIFKQPSSPNFFVELHHRKVQHKLSLGTSNLEAAACRARDMYRHLKMNGWEATLAKYRPAIAQKKIDCTLGEYIKSAKATVDIKSKTLEGYCQSIRKIASDLLELPDDGARYDYRGPGRAQWLGEVDAIKLSWLTPERIATWKKSFLLRAEPDPLSQRRVRISANFFMRNARSLFSAKIRRYLRLPLPDPLPLAGVELEPRGSGGKYYSSFDLGKLIEAARTDLVRDDPEAFKVFLLSAMAGLRRKEIDLLPWTAFRWKEGVIRIEHTHYFSPKTQDSSGDVAVDPELMNVFRKYLAEEPSLEFVINSPLMPRSRVTYNYYRCEAIFDRLTKWLRLQGIKSAKPIHELRKAFGSAICEKAGIHQASRSLRHSDIRVTSQVYVDSRSRISLGLGHLLFPP